MTLVHCERCGFLYEVEHDSGVTVFDSSVQFGSWVGPICMKCMDPNHNPKRGWHNMWYIDFISKRNKK